MKFSEDIRNTDFNCLLAIKKKRITILSDSQGKGLHSYVNSLEENFDVFVYAQPGAKIKRVVSEGIKLQA